MPEIAEPSSPERVAIRLSVFNGGHFLAEQLDSLLAQTHRSWQLYWRDGGSEDCPAALLCAFSAGPAKGGVTEMTESFGRLGALRSFLALLAAVPHRSAVAFADQDDVWPAEKLTRGLSALAAVPANVPALYCIHQTPLEAALFRIWFLFG